MTEQNHPQAREIQIGTELFAYIKKKQSFLDLKQLFLKLSTLDESLQTQLFKFVDVLPNLKEKESIAKILSEYIDESNFKAGFLVNTFSNLPIVNDVFKSLVTGSVSTLARIFICGQNTEEAFETITKLKKKNQHYTLDLLGEVVLTQTEADYYYEQYIDLLENIESANVSVKLSALVPQVNDRNFEEKRAILKERLRHLYRLAMKNNATVNVDSEHYSWHEYVFDIVKDVLAEKEFDGFQRAGIVVQAYLKESEKDLDAWISWAKTNQKRITIRLVKGAYWDSEQAHALQKSWEVPVFEDKALTDLNYEKLTKKILDHIDIVRPAFASHNIRSLAYAMRIVEEQGISKDDFEIQMLYGMLDDLKSYFSDNGYCLRVYLPYGKLLPGMSYLVRRLLENTANDSFLKQGFIDKKSQSLLLEEPKPGQKPEKVKKKFVNSADLDFDTKAQRNEFRKVLQETKEKFAADVYCPLLIGKDKVISEDSFKTVNPARVNEPELAVISKATVEHCDMAIEKAKLIQKKWFKLGVDKRGQALEACAREFEKKRLYLNAVLVLESGKAWHEADAETSEAIDFLNYYASEGRSLYQTDKLYSFPGEKNRNHYQALGLSLVVSPWNFPFAITLGMAAANLIVGNGVLIKPSMQTSLIAYEALEILLDQIGKVAGEEFKDILSFLPGAGSVVGQYMIEHELIRCIAFTGSNATGMHINEVASKSRPVKRFISEMGGKNPIIVDKTADLDEAIPGVIYAAYGFSGQKCSACSRVIIEAEIYDEFKARMLEALKLVKLGDPESFEAYTGPVIDKAAFDNVHKYIKLAHEEGDVIFYEESKQKEGYFINPLLVENLSLDARVTQEEIFGPVLGMYKAQDLDEAIKLANYIDFGLTAGLYSRSPKNIDQFSSDIEAGNVYINRPCTGAVVARQAFGGHKNSSIGFKAGGPNYLLQFVAEKTVTENTMRRGFATD